MRSPPRKPVTVSDTVAVTVADAVSVSTALRLSRQRADALSRELARPSFRIATAVRGAARPSVRPFDCETARRSGRNTSEAHMAQFEALSLALELAQQLGQLLVRIQQHDRDMTNQLRRAATSIPSCLSEGSQRTGKDRLQLYRISAGSAAEVKVQIQLAVAWGYVEPQHAEPVLALADRMVAITWRLTRPRR